MIVMIISAVIIGLLFEGINIFRRYSHLVTQNIVDDSKLFVFFTQIESIVGRSDSLSLDYDIVRLHRKGEISAEIELIDSVLVIDYMNKKDSSDINIKSLKILKGRHDSLIVETDKTTLFFQTKIKTSIYKKNSK